MLDKLTEMFSKSPKNTYILIREGSFGVETYVNKYIMQFNPAYKKQLIEFLKGVVTMLEEKKGK